MLIDAHTHIFEEMRGSNPGGPVRNRTYGRVAIGDREIQFLPPFSARTCHSAETLVRHLDGAGVDKAVLLQGPWYGNQNDVVLAAIQAHPARLIGMAYLDPWAPDARETYAREVAAHPEFRGVKLEFSQSYGLCGMHPQARLDDPALAWLWQDLERRGRTLTFDLDRAGTVSYQTAGVRKIAEGYPGLKVVVAHLGFPGRKIEADADLWSAWHAQVALGELPNVWFDLAAMPGMLSDEEDYPYPSVERYLRIAVGKIGAHKLMWGTDIPALFSAANYPQFARLARQHTAFLGPDDQALVLGGTAAVVYAADG